MKLNKIMDKIKAYVNSKKETKKAKFQEDKISKEILSKLYDMQYLFYGECKKTVNVNEKTITYDHSEVFLLDSNCTDTATRVIRLTGNGISGRSIDVSYKESWQVGDSNGLVLSVEDNGIKYSIDSFDCMDEAWSSEHSITGYELQIRNDKFNSAKVNYCLKYATKYKEFNEMYNQD